MANITIRELSSGVRVVMEKIPHVKSCAMGIWVKNGAVDEYKEVAGISHFIEHMMFKGTKNRSARQIAEDIDRIGGQMNAFTGKEATCYYVKMINTHLIDGAEVLIDMLTESVFDSREMTKERQVICEEIKMIEDQPDDLAHDEAGKDVVGAAGPVDQGLDAFALEYAVADLFDLRADLFLVHHDVECRDQAHQELVDHIHDGFRYVEYAAHDGLDIADEAGCDIVPRHHQLFAVKAGEFKFHQHLVDAQGIGIDEIGDQGHQLLDGIDQLRHHEEHKQRDDRQQKYQRQQR